MTRVVHWLRSDLRLDDNRALGEAAARAGSCSIPRC
jgi:deoxyribodipyrimidine photolyase